MISGILLDLSGVVYTGDQPLEGAIAAIERLREADLPLRFITNTTRTPKRGLLERLHKMGVEVKPGELFTPAEAACNWLTENQRSPHLLIHPDLLEDFEGLGAYTEKALIVGDAGDDFTYQNLNLALRQLLGGAEFIALAKNRTFRELNGELSLDAGAFVAALEYGSQLTATVLGKPSPDFFAAALADMKLPASEVVMVGDDVEADVTGALEALIVYAILVRTGKYQPGAEHQTDPAPSAVVDDLSAAVDWILERRG